MANTTTSSTGVLTNGAVQSFVNQTVLENFEPKLFFKQFAEPPVSQRGYKEVVWYKTPKLTNSPAANKLTEGVTPVATQMSVTTVTATAEQYGMYVTITDVLNDVAADLNLIERTAKLVADNMARMVDRIVQDEVMDNIPSSNVFYAATTSGGTRAANRAALGATNNIFALDLAYAQRLLEEKNAPKMDGIYYGAIMHPAVSYHLRTENTENGGWISVSKYKMPEQILMGEIGELQGIRIFVSENVKTYASTVTVYPTMFFGGQGYGMSELQSLQTYYQTFGSGGTGDPIHQRATVGAKINFKSVILQEDSLLRFESAA